MIVTFYSFKGGVGRTLALANVSVVLAQNGHRVLAVDFDLEAPGLTRYLENIFGGDLQQRFGLLEILERQRSTKDGLGFLRECAVEVHRNPKGGVLEVLTSGRQDHSYPKRVLGFDWSEFFASADGGNFFEACRKLWIEQYDFILIDSRTGITDSGGICTIQLPDLIVPVFTASTQSVEGVIEVIERAQEGRQLLAFDRAPAAVLPLPSRFDSRTEYSLSQEWLDQFASRFSEFYSPWLPRHISVRQVVERTKLPYVPFFSFGERLPIFEESGSDPESLSYALGTIASLLEAHLQEVGEVLAFSGVSSIGNFSRSARESKRVPPPTTDADTEKSTGSDGSSSRRKPLSSRLSRPTTAKREGASVLVHRPPGAWRRQVEVEITRIRHEVRIALAGRRDDRSRAVGEAIEAHLRDAEDAIRRRKLWSKPLDWWRGTSIEQSFRSLHAARTFLVELLSDEAIDALVPATIELVRPYLESADPQWLELENLVNPGVPTRRKRAELVRALEMGYAAYDEAHTRVRVFRNVLLSATGLILLFMALFVIQVSAHPTIAFCFYPEITAAQAAESGAQGHVTVGTPRSVCPSGEQLVGGPAKEPSPADVWIVTGVGALGGALGAAVSARKISSSATPYHLTAWLALIKVASGALTAIAGILLLKAGFVPGLSNLDSQRQILAYALVFGYAQQLATRFLDKRASVLLAEVLSRNARTTPAEPLPLESTSKHRRPTARS